MSKKEAYERKIQAQLDEWKADIDKLKARADKAAADAQIKYYEEIDSLRAKQQQAQAKLDELRQSGEDAWEDMKGGVESAWDSLGEAVKSATSRFK